MVATLASDDLQAADYRSQDGTRESSEELETVPAEPRSSRRRGERHHDSWGVAWVRQRLGRTRGP